MHKGSLVVLIALVAACRQDPLEGLEPGTGPAVTDDALKALAAAPSGWVYFSNTTAPISRASTSPHPEPFIRVRYNAFAATQIDAAGRVKASASFPDSSVIVKEMSDGTTVSTLAVMMKLTGSSTAGFGGWVWGEYTPPGPIRYSTSGRGAACSSCHSRGIDYTRMNDTHH